MIPPIGERRPEPVPVPGVPGAGAGAGVGRVDEEVKLEDAPNQNVLTLPFNDPRVNKKYSIKLVVLRSFLSTLIYK